MDTVLMNPSPLAAEAIAGATDPSLQAILGDHWEYLMKWSPTYATTLGDHRYDAVLAPRDAASIARARSERDALIERLAGLELSTLGAVDQVTTKLLRGQLEADRGLDVCRTHEWSVDAYTASPLSELSYLVEAHQVTTPGDAENLLARLEQGTKLVDDTIANLRLGLGARRVASAEKLHRAIKQLEDELAKPADGWSIATPGWTAAPAPDPWPAGARASLRARLRSIVSQQLAPAFVRLRDFYRDELLPHGRTGAEGLASLPDGEACYRAAIIAQLGATQLGVTPGELHALGQHEIARTDRELAELGKRVFGAADLAAVIAKLRTDPSLYFTTREQILEAAQTYLDAAAAAVPRFFSVLPTIACVMREIPAYEAPYSTVAYYRQPHYDGSKPGEYFVNTHKPETRARFELQALTWHESIPGHHLQIALAQELGALPAFRKLDGSTAYVEGWALYTERLAEEMGLYTGDLDRLGKLSFDAWRAARLVVDTGIHALGWTRARAEAFMREHTALTEINISNEVDRYIGWPAQALAYKVGQLEILALRARAEAAFGAAFDLKEFHRIVLGSGAVTLQILAELVGAWIATAPA